MAWREKGQIFADGDATVPDDLNDTFIPMLSEINGGLDRDNFGYRILTHAKVVTNNIHRCWAVASDTPATYSTTTGNVLALTEIMSVTVDAEEWLSIKASFTFGRGPSAFSNPAVVFVALMVDDVIVEIEEPMECQVDNQTRSMAATVPVVPGSQNVRVIIGAQSLARNAPGIEVVVNSRGMTVVEGRR